MNKFCRHYLWSCTNLHTQTHTEDASWQTIKRKVRIYIKTNQDTHISTVNKRNETFIMIELFASMFVLPMQVVNVVVFLALSHMAFLVKQSTLNPLKCYNFWYFRECLSASTCMSKIPSGVYFNIYSYRLLFYPSTNSKHFTVPICAACSYISVCCFQCLYFHFSTRTIFAARLFFSLFWRFI